MSAQPLWLQDLVAYSIQAAVLVGVGAAMVRALGLREPRVRLAYWQGLLLLCLLLPVLQPWRREILETSGTAGGSVALSASAASPSGLPLAQVVLLLILTGMAVRAAWIAIGLARLSTYRRRASRLEPLPAAVEEARRLAPAPAAILISNELRTPATFGFFHPAILFPERFREMHPSMQKAVALHELLHVRRRDWLWNLAEEAVLTLFWFHIPLWWAVRSARLSREQVVDAESIRRTGERRSYLKAVLEMAAQRPLAANLPAPLFLHESQLAERVALMIKEVQMSRKRLTISVLAVAVTLLAAIASLAWAFPLQVSSSAISPETASSQEAGSDSRGAKVYKVGKDVQAPRPIYQPEPAYTRQARKNHISGKVAFSCVVDAQGNVTAVKEISRPLGDGLDEGAIQTIRTWKFHPGTRNGQPVSVEVTVEITFRLYDKADDASKGPDAAADPPPQAKAEGSQAVKVSPEINQEELHRQVRQAMEQVKIAQQATAKLDEVKVRQQVEQAMKQAKVAEAAAAKVNQADVQRQVRQAIEQVKIAQQATAKLDEVKVRQQVEQAMKQAKVAEQAAAKIRQADVQHQVEQALKQARQQVEAAKKEAAQAREELRKERLMLEKENKAAKPSPPAAPAAVPAPPDVTAPPPASPQANPNPPSAPPSAKGIGASPARTPPPEPASPASPQAGIVGGVPSGKVNGVPGGVVAGIAEEKVRGVPGGVTGATVGGVPAAPSQP